MFSWYPVMDLARAPRRAARKKGSGYENGLEPTTLEVKGKCANYFATEAPCFQQPRVFIHCFLVFGYPVKQSFSLFIYRVSPKKVPSIEIILLL